RKDFSAPGSYPIVGDKITLLDSRFDVFTGESWKQRDITILHILRPLHDVVQSYESRKADAADTNWQRGVEEALEDWGQSVQRTYEFCMRPNRTARVGIVDYDAAFGGDLDSLIEAARKIYLFAGIPFGPDQLQG